MGYKLEEKALLDALHRAPSKKVLDENRPVSAAKYDVDHNNADEEEEYADETFETLEEDDNDSHHSDDDINMGAGLNYYGQYRSSSDVNSSPQQAARMSESKLNDSKAETSARKLSDYDETELERSLRIIDMNSGISTEEWNPVLSASRGRQLPSTSTLIMPAYEEQDDESPPNSIAASKISQDSMYVTLADPTIVNVVQQIEVPPLFCCLNKLNVYLDIRKNAN